MRTAELVLSSEKMILFRIRNSGICCEDAECCEHLFISVLLVMHDVATAA